MAGLTPAGFERKTIEEILDEIETEERSRIDPSINVQAETPIGQLNGIFAAKLGEIWELMEAVNANQYPSSASAFGLDGVAEITGTFRADATKGTVVLSVDLDAATLLPAGSIAQVAGDPSNRWVTTQDVTSVGAGVYNVPAEAEVAGDVPANASTITVIVTPVAGWNTVTNSLAPEPGTDIDTDAQLRTRREAELSRAGSATVNAIRADVLAVDGVTSANVFNNPTDVTDGDGVPPHSIEVLVLGGTDDDVALAIFESVAAGIGTFGSSSAVVVDSQGFSHTVSFSRPTVVSLDIEVDVVVGVDYPAGGDTLVETAVTDFVTALAVGKDANRFEIGAAALTVLGVLNISDVRIEETPTPPVSADFVIAARELAAVASVVVVSTPGTP